MNQKFVAFLESLKNEENAVMIEAIKEGYEAIALTEAYLPRLPAQYRTNDTLRREVDKLETRFNRVADIMDKEMGKAGELVANKVSARIMDELSAMTFDGEFAGVLKENFQKIESNILSKPNLTENYRQHIAAQFDGLYNQLFRVADEIGYAM